MTADLIPLLVGELDEAFRGPAWHGPALLGSLRDVDPEAACWRPGPGRHCIWELALHTAYWKYIVRRRITGATRRGGFPRTGSNFPRLPARAGESEWSADLTLLEEEHERLKQAVAALPLSRLNDAVGTSRWTVRQHVVGAAAHDVYHTGQIQLLKKLRQGG